MSSSRSWGVSLIASGAIAIVLSGAWVSSQTPSPASAPATQAAANSGGPPPLPYVELGACPFECCTYRDWRASRPISAQENWDNPRETTARRKTVFGIARGDTITAMTGHTMTTKAGHLRVAKDATLTVLSSQFPKQPVEKIPVHAGDIVYLLVPHGEAAYSIWYGGRVLERVDMSDLLAAITEANPNGAPPKDVLEQPAFEWWVRVRNQQGDIGWTDRARDFAGADACSNALPSR